MCVTRYVECGGLSALLESMATLASLERSSANISDAVLQLDCLCCLRTLLSRRDGLQMFVDDQDHVNKLVECQCVTDLFLFIFNYFSFIYIYVLVILVRLSLAFIKGNLT